MATRPNPIVLLALSASYLAILPMTLGKSGDHCCTSAECITQIPCKGLNMSCCTTRPTWEGMQGGVCYNRSSEVCAYCAVPNPNHPNQKPCPMSASTCCGGNFTCINQQTTQCCRSAYPGSREYGWECPANSTCCGGVGLQNCCGPDSTCDMDQCVRVCGQPCYEGSNNCNFPRCSHCQIEANAPTDPATGKRTGTCKPAQLRSEASIRD